MLFKFTQRKKIIMNKNIIFLVIGMFIGIISSFLFINILNSNGDKVSKIDIGILEQDINSIEDELNGIKKNNTTILHNVEIIKESIDLIYYNKEEKTTNNEIANDKYYTKKEKILNKEGNNLLNNNENWTSVINKKLAKVLIEEGLTPYDIGVSPYLKDASRKIEELERQLNKTTKEIRVRYPNIKKSRDNVITSAYNEEMNIAYNKYNEEIKRIANEFRSSLMNLKKSRK